MHLTEPKLHLYETTLCSAQYFQSLFPYPLTIYNLRFHVNNMLAHNTHAMSSILRKAVLRQWASWSRFCSSMTGSWSHSPDYKRRDLILFQHCWIYIHTFHKAGIPWWVRRLDKTIVRYTQIAILITSQHTEGSGSTPALQSFTRPLV